MTRWLLVAALLVGCGSDPGPAPRKAAEPAKAPVPSAAPTGDVVDLGAEAEGVVADAATHLAAVGTRSPNALVLVDTRTGRVVRRVPLPGHVRHLGLRGSTVLVPVEDANRLLEVDLRTGSVTADVATGAYPHGVSAVGADAALVGAERGGAAQLVQAGAVTGSAQSPQPGGSAVTPQGLYVVDVADYSLTRLSSDLQRLGSVPAGDGPTHAVADVRGDVVVVDTRGDALRVFSPTLAARRTVRLPGTPYGVAYDAVRDEVWVTLTARNEVVRLAGPDLRETGRWPTVRQPNTVGVDSATGRVLVAGRATGELQLLSPG